MPASTKDGRRLTGYRGDTTTNNMGQIQHQSLYDDDMEEYQHHQVDDEDDYEEYDEDLDDVLQEVHNNKEEEEEEDDDTGSELSIPDPNIDFDMVYALHTFAATVEGQASVVRGDALTLLDDSNSYWWLVKVLKTAEVGYIPAENIETPHERLARLNSHRNIELTRKDIQDAFPVPPSNTNKIMKRVTLAKGVQFQSQIIYGSTDDDEDDEDAYFEAEFEQWNERMRSDDSEEDSDDQDSDDPYNYYDHDALTAASTSHAAEMIAPNQQIDNNVVADYYNETNNNRLSRDSDIIDHEIMMHNPQRDTMNLDDETIKISLTPSIARDDHKHNRASDSSIQTKLKKAAKLEKLLNGDNEANNQRRGSKDSNGSTEEKKKKSSIRKFFSRGSKDKKQKGNNDLERTMSNDSSHSVSSQSTVLTNRSNSIEVSPTKLKINAAENIHHFISGGIVESYKFVSVYPSTTANELIQYCLSDQQQLNDDNIYQDYYLIVKTLGGDEFTLIPSDKPLEIFHSLTAHLNTPMPSLKKARRISQLMGSDNSTHIGGPSSGHKVASEDEVQFYLVSKTKKVDEGEIQIKVSLYPSQQQQERVDKLVKIPSHILIKDAVTLLLEKFHILNGIAAAGLQDDNIKSLRLESEGDIVKYHLALNKDGQEYLLDLEEKLADVFDQDDMPQIHYRRNSNPDRSSITANIAPPEKNETFFILKCVESSSHRKREHQAHSQKQQVHIQQQQAHNQQQQAHNQQQQAHNQQQEAHSHQHHHKLVRQDTPMPLRESTPTNGFQPPTDQPIPVLSNTREILSASPTQDPPVLSLSPSSSGEDLISQLDHAIDTLNKPTVNPKARPQSTESLLYMTHDFGMNELMVMIRGAAASQPQEKLPFGKVSIRSEISDVFKDSQNRLDQLEKELDRLMAEAVKVY